MRNEDAIYHNDHSHECDVKDRCSICRSSFRVVRSFCHALCRPGFHVRSKTISNFYPHPYKSCSYRFLLKELPAGGRDVIRLHATWAKSRTQLSAKVREDCRMAGWWMISTLARSPNIFALSCVCSYFSNHSKLKKHG
jgi:hypothetical protein